MWRRLLRIVHPDTGGAHDLFIWVNALHEHVAGDGVGEPRAREPSEPPRHHPPQTERVDFTRAFEEYESHEHLTRTIAALLGEIEEPYASVLKLLSDCYPSVPTDATLQRAEHQGASYKQLAYIGHLAGMDGSSRMEFYRVAEAIPLSQRHAGHLIAHLREEAA
jgi:hypothetical protein